MTNNNTSHQLDKIQIDQQKSLKRIIDEIIRRTPNFEKNFKQNYSRHKRKIKLFVKTRTAEIMNSMIKDYETNLETHSCNCGESRLISSMMDTKIPCSHLFFLGDDFPKIEAPKINIHNCTNGELFYQYNINSTPRVQIDASYITKTRKYVCKVIKKYSRCKNKTQISTFVNQQLPFHETPKTFVLGYPSDVFRVIDEGIIKFYQDK